jgi:hypothetical protein
MQLFVFRNVNNIFIKKLIASYIRACTINLTTKEENQIQ